MIFTFGSSRSINPGNGCSFLVGITSRYEQTVFILQTQEQSPFISSIFQVPVVKHIPLIFTFGNTVTEAGSAVISSPFDSITASLTGPLRWAEYLESFVITIY